MNEKKDKWEQLTEIPQDYEVNPDLIKKAESAMRQERRTTRRNVHVWQTVAGSLAACCLLLIMIPAFRSLGNGPITPPIVRQAPPKKDILMKEALSERMPILSK